MNLKNKYTKLILSIVLIICIFSVKFTFALNIIRENNSTVDIIDSINSGKEINIEKYGLYLDKKKSKKYNSTELLALAYYDKCNDGEDSIYYLKEAFQKINRKTNFDTKYTILSMLINEFVEDDNTEEIKECIKKIGEFSKVELEVNIYKVVSILFSIVEVPEVRKEVIEILENIVEKDDSLSLEIINAYRNNLGLYYVMDGQYSNAAEMFLLTIDSYKGYNNINSLKSMVDLGGLFVIINRYDIAEEIFREVIEVTEKLNHDGLYNNMMIYGYISLYEVLIYENKIDEFLEISNEIQKYYSNVEESFVNSTNEIYKLLMASALISKGELVEAESYIFDVIIKDNSTYLDDGIFNLMTLGDYYFAQEMYEKAISIYESAYNSERHPLEKKYEKMIIKKLADAFENIGDKDKELVYRKELIEVYSEEQKKVANEYIDYIFNKYKLNKEVLYWNKIKVIAMFIVTVFCVIFTMMTIQYFKQRKKIRIDWLSGAYKRDYFDKYLRKIMRLRKEFYLILFDIDNFKNVNDTYGHSFGDEVITKIAQTTKNNLDKKSKLFRYGGEEFVVVLEIKDKDEAIKLAENIRSSVEEIKFKNDIKVTISVGISKDKNTIEATFETADNNLYKAKNSGKNKVVF